MRSSRCLRNNLPHPSDAGLRRWLLRRLILDPPLQRRPPQVVVGIVPPFVPGRCCRASMSVHPGPSGPARWHDLPNTTPVPSAGPGGESTSPCIRKSASRAPADLPLDSCCRPATPRSRSRSSTALRLPLPVGHPAQSVPFFDSCCRPAPSAQAVPASHLLLQADSFVSTVSPQPSCRRPAPLRPRQE